MYLLQKIVGAFTEPLILALTLAAIAALLRLLGWRRLCTGSLALAAGIAYVGSIAPTGDLLLGALERRHPPLREDQVPRPVQHIVVLGSGYAPFDRRPIALTPLEIRRKNLV